MRLGFAPVAIGLALIASPAHAQEDLMSFLFGLDLDSLAADTLWDLECYQAGKKVISETNLRVAALPQLGRFEGFNPQLGAFESYTFQGLTTQDGRLINVQTSVDLACILRQKPDAAR